MRDETWAEDRGHDEPPEPYQFDWDCPHCGRHFEDMTDKELATGCPSDDCPSHEEK